MRDLADELDTPLLVGVTAFVLDATGIKHFNSAAFVPLGDGPIGRYDKMHRVVFGEYVPFAEELSWLVKLTPLSSLNLAVDPGAQPAVFDVAGLRIAPNICYESVMPQVIRGQVNTLAEQGREPDVLVNLTNDGWFWGSSELDMHLACGVFRAVECRKPFLIAANTGFSAWIDADGRVLARGPRRATGVLLAEVSPERRTSWYLTWGDWPAGICLAACLFFAAVGGWDRYRSRWVAKSAGTSPSAGQSKAGKANRPRSRAGRVRRSRSRQRP
jgi:apolipoprotein N-acyltransferase